MLKCNIKPMPLAYRKIKKLFRPCHPPPFEGGPRTQADIDYGMALLRELDPDSQEWWGYDPAADAKPKPRKTGKR